MLAVNSVSDSNNFCFYVYVCFFQQKKGGGISFNSTVPLTKCSEKMAQLILHEYSILAA